MVGKGPTADRYNKDCYLTLNDRLLRIVELVAPYIPRSSLITPCVRAQYE